MNLKKIYPEFFQYFKTFAIKGPVGVLVRKIRKFPWAIKTDLLLG